MSKKYVVGLDLGGTKIYTALVDFNGTIIKEKVVETLAFEGEEAVINRMMDTIDYVIEGTDKELIKAIGIGAPGALDLKEGIVIAKEEVIYRGRYMNREINKSQLAKALKKYKGD